MKQTDLNRPRMTVSIPFMILGMLFCVCLIAANLLEAKQVEVAGLSLTAGLIVFPVSYVINDCIVEVYGYVKARLVIWLGFFMNFLFVLFGFAADLLPAAPYWTGQEGFHAVFGLAPRIAGASFLAFLVGSFLNAYVMSIMKSRSRRAVRFFVARHSLHAGRRRGRLPHLFPLGARRRHSLGRHAVGHAESGGAEDAL